MNEYIFTERHMGTDVSLSIVCPSQTQAETIAAEVFAIVHDYELRFSRFLPESELSQLNQTGSQVVSDAFWAVVTRSRALSKLTDGAFNPLVQVRRLGYEATFATQAKMTATVEAEPQYNTDLSALGIDEASHTVTLAPGQQLDFGGILKGYVAELLADRIMATTTNCQGCIVNLGGDLATRGYDALHQPFIFMLYNPVTGAETAVPLTDTSLCTSGTYARQWQTSAGQRHHIVDSTSRNNPDTTTVAVSIIHPDGACSEALTKLFLVRGTEGARAVAALQTLPYQYFAVRSDGTTQSNVTT